MKTINSSKAPSPVGPYSQAVLTGNTLFCSGQIAIDPETGALNNSTIEIETQQIMQNIKHVLTQAGFSFQEVVKSTIFLRSMDDFKTVNEVYGSFFTTNPPARETVAVAGLPLNVNVEISVIAVKE